MKELHAIGDLITLISSAPAAALIAYLFFSKWKERKNGSAQPSKADIQMIHQRIADHMSREEGTQSLILTRLKDHINSDERFQDRMEKTVTRIHDKLDKISDKISGDGRH